MSTDCCCFSVAQSCPTLCDPMNCSTPGFLVLHCLPEFAETHVHWVSDAIQPSHPLSSPSPPAFSLSQPPGLFQWVSSSHQVAKVLDLQHQSFQWVLGVDRWITKKMHIHTMEYYSAFLKKGNNATHDHMDESGRHYAKWNKPVSKDQHRMIPLTWRI